MSLVTEMQEWQKDLEDLSVEKGKAEGRLQQAMDDLKEAGFDSIEAAKKELEHREQLRARVEEEARQTLAELKEKYKDHIEV